MVSSLLTYFAVIEDPEALGLKNLHILKLILMAMTNYLTTWSTQEAVSMVSRVIT